MISYRADATPSPSIPRTDATYEFVTTAGGIVR
jgi:hypothetical protein